MIKRITFLTFIFSLFFSYLMSLSTISGMGHLSYATLINGAGATFPFPIYSKWFYQYERLFPNVKINYQSIGSGGGIRQFNQKTLDFGATDIPMSDEQISRDNPQVIHIPMVLGAAVFVYHIPGVQKGLKLSSEVIADIFLGKILFWNHPKILAINEGLSIPPLRITVVRRSDGSGTTAILTHYLSKISPEWAKKVGSGTSVNWPVGLGGKGNEGVSGLIQHTEGSIGYVELIFAETNKMSYAQVENLEHQYVFPTLKAVTAAAEGALKDLPEDLRLLLTCAPGKNSYPISAFTYILIRSVMPQLKGEKLIQFLYWALEEGQKSAETLHYAPLPPQLILKVKEKLKSVTYL